MKHIFIFFYIFNLFVVCQADIVKTDENLNLPNIIIYGDSRTNIKIHNQIINLIIRQKPAAVFHTGDLVANGDSQSEWNTFNNITSSLLRTTPFYPAAGNHENESSLYYNNFQLPENGKWYSVDIKNMHFIILNSNLDLTTNSLQYSWLINDLNKIEDKDVFRIVLFHHPVFTVSLHEEDEKGFKRILLPVFDKYKINIVFTGHNHIYERAFYNNIYYIVTGGGGAPLYGKIRNSVYNQFYLPAYHFCKMYYSDKELIIEAIDLKSNRIDKFSIRK